MLRIFISIILLICQTYQLTAQSNSDLTIRNVNVVDVVKGEVKIQKDVFVVRGRITAIKDHQKGQLKGPDEIDGTGKFLIPGLWDMHTHNWWQLHFSNEYIKNGVLGVRNMYTPMNFIQPLKDSIQNGLLPGPKYVAAGRVIEGANPEFPDWLVVDSIHKIKPALDTLQMEGSDFVKVYNKIPRDVYFELVKEARKRGLRVEGHLPMSVSAIEASNAGQRSFEHLLGMPDLCTHDSLFNHRTTNNWFSNIMKESDLATMQIDEELAKKNFDVLKKNKTWVCPTLVVWYSYLHPDTLFENDPDVKLAELPNEITGFWKQEIGKYRAKDSTWKETARLKYENIKKVTRLMYDSGVPLLAGTDAMNPYCIPGFGLHKEFILLKDCGIPDKEILKMATCNPAQFLELNDYGQISEGMNASMVILNQNPLDDIRNTSSIHKVILNGKVIKTEN